MSFFSSTSITVISSLIIFVNYTTVIAINYAISNLLKQTTLYEDIYKCLQVILQTKYVKINKNSKIMYIKHVNYLLNDRFWKLYVNNNIRDYRAHKIHDFYFYKTDSLLSDISHIDNYDC